MVDRNVACLTAAAPEMNDPALPPIESVTADWGEFFHGYLSRWETEGGSDDAVVPSPLMPHLMYEWLRDRAAARWPQRTISTRPLNATAGTPWERVAPDGSHYVSFADWMCPVNCIEPERCPHTRGPRTWTMPAAVKALVERRREAGDVIQGPIVFHCTHRAYGVGMIDTRDVVAADRQVAESAIDGPATFLVGTVSHCHGALNLLSVV